MATPDVALISPYPTAGERHGGHSGVASYTAALAHALAGHGASVTVLAPGEGDAPARASDGPVRVERPYRRGASALPAAAAAAVATRAPAVHLQHELFLYGGPASVPGLPAALMRLRRAVVTMHHVVDPSTVDGGFTRLHRVRAPASVARAGLAGVQASIRRLAGAVIVHEPAFRRVVPEAVVVPHGMEEARAPARPIARAALGLADERRLVVLCFGFLAPYKGLEAALAAATEARDAVRLVVAGGEHPRLAEAGDGYAAGLRARFGAVASFTGHVPDHAVGTMFAAADLALFPYPRPFASSGPLALALAHGTPVLLSPALASCIGAPPALAAPLDPPALAAELRVLAGSPERRAALTDAAAALAAGRSWPAVARRHLELYGEVSDAQRAASGRLRAA